MLPLWSALNSGVGRRLVAGVATAMALLLVAAFTVTAQQSSEQQAQEQALRLDAAARQSAEGLEARIQAADAIVAAHALDDAGVTGLSLRERLAGVRSFRDVTLLSVDPQGIATAGALLFELSAVQQGALHAGGSVLYALPVSEAAAQLYLLHEVRTGSDRRIAAFAFAPDWLWQPPRVAAAARLQVFSANAGVLFGQTGDSRAYRGLIEAPLRSGLNPGASRNLSWQADGDAWAGSLAALEPLASFAGASLAVLAAEPTADGTVRAAAIGKSVPLLLLVGTVLTLAVSMFLLRAWMPALAALRRGLHELREERAVTLRIPTAADEPRQLLDAFNHAAAAVLRRSATLRTLAEIDALMLASNELEEVMDAVLARVREVTRCRAVGIGLIDANAGPHARLFVASHDGDPLPVARVALDPSLLDTLRESPEGLTIARCEDERHSCLQPLEQAGAHFFWAWPVFAGDRLAAILAVGYDHPARAEATLAAYGTDCAHRLGAALSSNARSDALYHQAHFDPLTQLPNRLLFRDRLAQELVAVATTPSRGALLYVDLDHFKKINDSLGHDAGDQVLAITAQRLRSCVKEGDTVARLAGDEFTVILRQVIDPSAAHAVADRIVESLQLPVNIAGQDHHVRASIGITLYPDDGVEIDELLRNADLAMYRAKALGRGTAVFFDRRMIVREARIIDSGLHRALKRREFTLFFQPQYSLVDGRLLGMEALLRWNSARDGVRHPRDFVPAAEESGLMADIGGWVLENACAQVAAWREAGLAPPRVAINVAPQQLRDRRIVDLTRRMLDAHGLEGGAIEMELTEAALADPEAEATLRELANLGVQLTLDDFGTGYSALGHLRRYPVGTVKIDRSFIEDVPSNQGSAALAETIIVMAHKLGKRVVAEGVETLEQLEFLRERGCDCAQGYYLARPLSAGAMADMLQGRLARADGNGDSAATG